MANLNSSSDLKKQILQNCGEVTDGGSSYDADGTVLKYMNDSLLKVCGASSPYGIEVGELWSWAKSPRPGIITLKAPYSTGTVNLDNGLPDVNFTAAPDVALGSFVGAFLKVEGRPEYFQIIAHIAGDPTCTLDGPYTGQTTDAAFKIIMLDYTIGSSAVGSRILRLGGPMRTYKSQNDADDEGKIHLLDYNTLSKAFPLSRLTSMVPSKCAIISEADGLLVIRFNGYVTEDCRVEYDFIPVPVELLDSDTSIPAIPREFRCVIEYASTYRLMLEKEDSRADTFLQLTQATLKSMQASKRKVEHQASGRRGEMTPRADLYGKRRSDFR